MLKRAVFVVVFFSTSLLVAAFKLLPRQSRRKPQVQRNQLGVVGWRLMGNLLISPPFVCQYAWTAQPGGRQSLPKRLGRSNVGVWALLSCLCEIKTRLLLSYYLTNGLFQLHLLGFALASHVTIHRGGTFNMTQVLPQNAFCALINEVFKVKEHLSAALDHCSVKAECAICWNVLGHIRFSFYDLNHFKILTEILILDAFLAVSVSKIYQIQ